MYNVSTSYTDTTSDAGTYWSFPEDDSMTWEDACAEALRQALKVHHTEATLFCQGEIDLDGNRSMTITVQDDSSRHTFHVC